jgi:hypothetical protein
MEEDEEGVGWNDRRPIQGSRRKAGDFGKKKKPPERVGERGECAQRSTCEKGRGRIRWVMEYCKNLISR